MCYPFKIGKAVLACGLLALAAVSANAQEIKWRTSYAAAREESEKKNIPLLIYFTRPACVYCDKLEATTYRDPRILAALSDKVVPLKINGLDQPKLTESLGITAYPTIVLARPDAQYEVHVGYQEPGFMHDKLAHLISVSRPNELGSVDYENAKKWEAVGEYGRAVSALKNVLDDSKSKAQHTSAQELLDKIERRADERLTLAKSLQASGKLAEAMEALTDLQQQFAGLKAANDAAELANKLGTANTQLRAELRHKRLRELTAQAEDFYRSKDYIPCLDRCELINREFGDLPEARKAYALAAEIKNNPEWLQGAADVMTDRLGTIWLALADNHLKRGEPKRAEFYLQRVVSVFPGTRLAESAQIRLTQLRATMPATSEIGATRP
jgi:tetratricopeptide (TPR) repeat protein